MRSNVQERLRHNLADSVANRLTLSRRLSESRLKSPFNVGESVFVGHTRVLFVDLVVFFTQIVRGTIWHRCHPFKWLVVVLFFIQDQLLLQSKDETRFDFVKVIDVDLLADKLFPDYSWQVKNHLSASANTNAHQDSQEVE